MKRLRGIAILVAAIPFFVYAENMIKEAQKSPMGSEFGSAASNPPLSFKLAKVAIGFCFVGGSFLIVRDFGKLIVRKKL
jgi:hypothetical protein